MAAGSVSGKSASSFCFFFRGSHQARSDNSWPYKGKGEDMPLMLLPISSDACFSTSVDSEIAVVGVAKMIFAADVHMFLCRFADLIYVSFSIYLYHIENQHVPVIYT